MGRQSLNRRPGLAKRIDIQYSCLDNELRAKQARGSCEGILPPTRIRMRLQLRQLLVGQRFEGYLSLAFHGRTRGTFSFNKRCIVIQL